ncbi:MAG: hypothetical protein H7Y43_04870 [Akkermansiaceae bacterium]|nr:hypothetical protein [Verrucomicrobiales bacterium]
MKRFVTKVQNLSQKAAEIQQAIQSIPPRIAEIRESVSITAGQLQQLRANVQTSVADLRVDNPDRVVEALQEINDNAAVFEEAGYVLSGVDMELSPVERLIVHLDKFEDVPHSAVRALITANQNHKTVHGLLSSLLQAEAVADRVALNALTYRTLIINVGPIPSVRLCWRAGEEVETQEPLTVSQATAAIPPAISAPTSAFTQSSFFEARTRPTELSSQIPASTTSLSTTASSAETHHTSSAPESEPATVTDWKLEALERLKKNPHVSKYGSRR